MSRETANKSCSLDCDLIDLYIKAGERITSSWKASVLINALTIGWVIALYVGIMKLGTDSVPPELKCVLTLIHFPAYFMSGFSLWKEYDHLQLVREQIITSLEELDQKSQEFVHSLLEVRYKRPKLYARLLVIVTHTWYALIIYAIIWFPTTFLPDAGKSSGFPASSENARLSSVVGRKRSDRGAIIMNCKMNMIYWKSEKFWLGKLLEHPEIMTQGESLEELEANLKEAYLLMAMDDVPERYETKEIFV